METCSKLFNMVLHVERFAIRLECLRQDQTKELGLC